MADWITKSSESIYKTAWMEVFRDEVQNALGEDLVYSYIKLPAVAVTIIATNIDGEILLQRNYRYVLHKRLWEVPSGHSDGQEPLIAAKRELLEEAGRESDDWSSLGEAQLACGVADFHHYIFLARNAQITTDDRDEEEDITDQQFFSISQIKQMILDDKIIDGDTLIGLYRYMLQEGVSS